MNNLDYSYRTKALDNGGKAMGDLSIKNQIMGAMLSGGLSGNVIQNNRNVSGSINPYVSAEYGPLSVTAERNLNGYVDNNDIQKYQDNTYSANLDIPYKDQSYGAGVSKFGDGNEYSAYGTVPFGFGKFQGDVSYYDPKSGDPSVNAMIKYKRKF